MIRAILVAAAILTAGIARAQEPASVDLLSAAIQAIAAQRDQALNDSARASAQLTLAQRDIARLRKELDDAKRAAPPPGPSK